MEAQIPELRKADPLQGPPSGNQVYVTDVRSLSSKHTLGLYFGASHLGFSILLHTVFEVERSLNIFL